MTNETQPRKTTAEYQHELMLQIGNRESELRLAIANATSQIHNLRIQARQHSDRQDNDAARAAMAEAGRLDEGIRSMNKTLADLEIERQGLVRGSDPRLDGYGHAERAQNRMAMQTEHAQAVQEFNELMAATGPLVHAAKRLVQSCIGMRLDPPAAALEIAKTL